MKKVVVSLILVLSLSLISAGFFSDTWEKITGAWGHNSNYCTDHDGGLNLTEGSYVSASSGTYSDSCYNTTYVIEYTCEYPGPTVMGSTYNCLEGMICQEGACVEKEYICESFPCFFNGTGGFNSKGFFDSPPNIVSEEYPYKIYLDGSQEIGMNLRYSAWGEKDYLTNTIYVKVDGIEVFLDTMDSSDYKIQNFSLGVLSKGKHSIEIYASPSPNHFMFDWFNLSVINSTSENIVCIDSDGGINYFETGVTTEEGWFSSTSHFSHDYNDGCGYTSNYDELREYYCDENGNAIYVDYVCPNGCKDGACVNISSFIIKNIDPFVFEGQFLENHLDVDIHMAEYKYNEILGENLVTVFVGKTDDWREIFEREILEQSLQSQYSYKTTNQGVIIFKHNVDGRNFFVWISNNLGIVINQHSEIISDKLVEAYLEKYPSTLNSAGSCQDLLFFMKNPSNLFIGDEEWELDYSYSSDEDDSSNEEYFYRYAGWSNSNDYSYNSFHFDIEGYSNINNVLDMLNWSLNSGLCKKQKVYFEDDSEQIVYVCKGIWDVVYSSQEDIGSSSPQDENLITYWVSNNTLFRLDTHFYSYDNEDCSSYESCKELDERKHQEQQEDLIDAFNKLRNNKEEYVFSISLSSKSRNILRYFLQSCNSDLVLKDGEYQGGSWYCKLEPAICPPHGEQTEVCTRYNYETGKQEEVKRTVECSPGICSGCYVPRWFGSVGDNTCIPYGFRFEQRSEDFVDVWRESVEKDSFSEGNEDYSEIEIKVTSETTATFRLLEWEDDWEDKNVTINLVEGEKAALNLEKDESVILFPEEIVYYGENDSRNYINFEITVRYLDKEYSQLNMYCDIDGGVKVQKTVDPQGNWVKCQNSYECFSNVCSGGECIEVQSMMEDVGRFKSIFGKVFCKLAHLFNEDNYNSCLKEYFD